MTEQEILNNFSGFDNTTLRKLKVIGESLLTPLDTELTSVDFASMVDSVFRPNGLADRFFPEWTDRSSSDFGRFLVELFAIFSDKDFFYINHFSQESFIGVAELYRSVAHKALNIGFNPPSNKSATGIVQLTFSSGSAEFVPRGSIMLGIDNFPDLVYVNDDFTIDESTIDTVVDTHFIQGKPVEQQLTFNGHSLIIDTPKIVDKSIRLYIDGDIWVETDSFINGTPNDKHFKVFYSEDGMAEIFFASGGLGSVPLKGSICKVLFLTGGGYIGDISYGTLNLIVNSQTKRNLLSFVQYEMQGGTDMLPLETLREVVIGKQRTQNRVVTPEDAEYFAKELSFVSKVYADVFLNMLYVYVLPTSGGSLSESQKELVENKITPYLIMGQNLVVSDVIYVPITLSVDIYLLPKTIKAGAYTTASKVIEEELNPMKLGSFGAGVNRAYLASKLLQKVNGAQNIVFTELRRSGMNTVANDLTFLKQEVVDIENTVININLIGGI